MAFQMVAVILIGVYGGVELDRYFELNFPFFTIFLSLTSTMGSIYLVLKDFIKK
jgi:F0F1-type ATP synthase assembly protein I